ncbi:MAG: hypothetical protein ACYCQM_02510 [Acidithiobacillus sp.]
MKISRREIFPIVLGLADGTCTALVLASQKMMMGGIDVWQAFRIGIITSASGFLPLWVAEYAGLRSDLVRMAKQLNMASAHALQKSDLGLQTLRNSWFMASLATADAGRNLSEVDLSATFCCQSHPDGGGSGARLLGTRRTLEMCW